MAATDTNCHLIDHVRTLESPLITSLVAAMRHLERSAGHATTPADEAGHYGDHVNADQVRDWVLGNAERIRKALDTITAPYTTAH